MLFKIDLKLQLPSDTKVNSSNRHNNQQMIVHKTTDIQYSNEGKKREKRRENMTLINMHCEL
jgi:hypothetical protein